MHGKVVKTYSESDIHQICSVKISFWQQVNVLDEEETEGREAGHCDGEPRAE